MNKGHMNKTETFWTHLCDGKWDWKSFSYLISYNLFNTDSYSFYHFIEKELPFWKYAHQEEQPLLLT